MFSTVSSMYLLSVLHSEYHMWSECGIDGKSVASPHVNHFLAPTH